MSKVASTVATAASVRALVAAKRPKSWQLGYPVSPHESGEPYSA